MRPFHVTKLKNNIRLAHTSGLSAETSAVGVWINTGARYEPEQVKGIAHYLEHLLFKGSRHYSYKKLKQEIEGRGGVLNGFTSQEMTCYYAKVLNKNIFKTLDILLDMVFFPLLNNEDVQKERKVILEEVKMQNDLPQSRSEMLLDELLWGDTPLGCDVIGTEKTIRATTQKDIAAYLKAEYIPAHMLISVCSNTRLSQIQRYIEKKCAHLPAKSPARERFEASSLQPGIQSRIEQKDLFQTHLVVGFKGLCRADVSTWILKLIHVILGANMSSRLFEKVREEQALAYDISTAYRSYHDSGCFSVHTGLAGENVVKTLQIVFKELRRLQETLVRKDEFQRAQDYLLGQHIMAFERNMDMMLYMGENLLGIGYVPVLREVKERIHSVTPSQVRKMAQYIFAEDLIKVSLVGKVDDTIKNRVEQFLKRLR